MVTVIISILLYIRIKLLLNNFYKKLNIIFKLLIQSIHNIIIDINHIGSVHWYKLRPSLPL